jgi:AraC family transcriptional regulator
MASEMKFEVRAAIGVQAPSVCNLVRALHADAAAGHPWGRMAGDSIFASLAALLVHDGRILQKRDYREGIGDRRIRVALEFIHAHLAEEMDVCSIANASGTSLFHLSREFRKALGCSPWQYVARLRAQLAAGLMRDASLTLAQVAVMSGFESYSSFAATFKATHAVSPTRFRAAL